VLTSFVSSVWLFALSALARRGPMHGYQIKREAQLDSTELRIDVKAGSLYNILRRMETEGLVRVIRTEREGNRPERRVYGITGQGRQELVALRDAALREVRLLPDPVDLALHYTPDLSQEGLAGAMGARREVVAARLAMSEQEYRIAAPHLKGPESMAFEHGLVRLRAELAWHDTFLHKLSSSWGTVDRDPTRRAGVEPFV
jgi:DNA-binding PadR family transcriptional regulator